MSTSNIPDLEEFEAEIFFGKETAIAGKCALVTAGFDIESRPSVDGFDDVWLVARACCDRGADVYDLVRTVEAAWWELIGRPLEIVSGVKIGGLFKKTVENDELAGAIAALFSAWWGCFQGREVQASAVHKILHDDMGRISGMLAKDPTPEARLYDAFFAATGGKLPDYRKLDTREVGSRLKSLDGYVADIGEEVTVKFHTEHDHKDGNRYSVKILKGALPMAAQRGA